MMAPVMHLFSGVVYAVILLGYADLEFNGTVVGAEDFVVNFRVAQLRPQGVGHDKVVDSPPRVVVSGVETVGPPGINVLLCRVKIPEGIGKAGIQQLAELAPFLIGKAGVKMIGLRIF